VTSRRRSHGKGGETTNARKGNAVEENATFRQMNGSPRLRRGGKVSEATRSKCGDLRPTMVAEVLRGGRRKKGLSNEEEEAGTVQFRG